MRNLYIILLVLCSQTLFAQVALPTFQAVQKPHVVSCGGTSVRVIPGGDNGAFLDGSSLNPGDTVKLNASSTWSYFSFANFNGTSTCPIVITTSSYDSIVTLSAGIEGANSSYVKITGRRPGDDGSTTTLSDWYGLYVTNPSDVNGVAINIAKESQCSHMEVDRVRVYKKTYGVWAKVEVSCDTTLNYMGDWSFRMDSMHIHHSYFSNIGQDVLYIGSTGQLPTDRPIECDSAGTPVTKYYQPMRLSNVLVHHNTIDSANRTAIQVSGADEGSQLIYNNTITRTGYEYNQQQGTGISIGGMTQGHYVTNNNISKTFLYGIFDIGAGIGHIEDNTVDSSGYIPINSFVNMDSLATATSCTNAGNNILKNTASNPGNILLSTKETVPSETKTAIIRNNLVGANATTGDPLGDISFANFSSFPQDWTEANVVCGNTRIDGVTAVEPNTFTYLGNPWPVYSTDCDGGSLPMAINPMYTKIPFRPTYQKNTEVVVK
jgi:hypothetical protein